MCKNKNLQKKMVDLFEKKVASIPSEMSEEEKTNYIIPVAKRDSFKKAIQQAFPHLRYRKIDGLQTILQFANKVEEESLKREDFFKKALEIIRTTSGHPEYTPDSVLFEECKPKSTSGNKRLSKESNYFVKCQKVYNALSNKMYSHVVFHPSAPDLEKATNLQELIDVYYRKGRF